jgi:LPS export ABC transporter protein LptC
VRPAALVAVVCLLAACRGKMPSILERPKQTLDGFALSQSHKGLPVWDLHSPSAELSEDAQTAVLSDPKLQFYKNGKLESTLRAESGAVDMQTQDVVLSSSVVATSISDGGTLLTEHLEYRAKSATFFTDRDVLVKRPGGTLRGKGLEANQDLSQIRIFKQRAELEQAPK